MSEYKRIRAEILSGATERVRKIAQSLRREALSAEELGTLSIITGLDKQIQEQAETRSHLRLIHGERGDRR